MAIGQGGAMFGLWRARVHEPARVLLADVLVPNLPSDGFASASTSLARPVTTVALFVAGGPIDVRARRLGKRHSEIEKWKPIIRAVHITAE